MSWYFHGSLHSLKLQVKYEVRSPKFIWAPVYSCTHWLRPCNPPPLPQHLGSFTRALLVSHDRRHLFVTPCLKLLPIILRSQIWSCMKVKRLFRIRTEVKIQGLQRPQNEAVEGRGRSQQRHGASKWSPGGSLEQALVTDSHHFHEEQDPDPDLSRIKVKTRIRIRIEAKSRIWIRIRIKVMRIRNPAFKFTVVKTVSIASSSRVIKRPLANQQGVRILTQRIPNIPEGNKRKFKTLGIF